MRIKCAQKRCPHAYVRKLCELMNTLQLFPSLYLPSYKCYYVSSLGPSFSITLYYLYPCVTNNPISSLITPAPPSLGPQALSRLSKRLAISLANGYQNNSMKEIGCKIKKARTGRNDTRIVKWFWCQTRRRENTFAKRRAKF
jgi:hypothetical protein